MNEDPRAWWRRLCWSAPEDLHGLWFGLVELSSGGWHLYVVGTDEFDAEDETAEWAVGPYRWSPDDRYLAMPEVETLGVDEAVGRAADLVRSLSPWDDIAVQGVATGYDDGDFEVVFVR